MNFRWYETQMVRISRWKRICCLFGYSNFWFFVQLLALLTLLTSCGNPGVTENIPGNDSLPPDLATINATIDKDRNNPELYFRRAKYYFSQKNFENAISDMNIALKIDSTKPEYYIFLSDLHFTQNKTRDTRDMLWKAIRLDSGNSEALMKYSQLFYLLRKYDTAMFYVNRSLHYNRSNTVAHFQKGMILKEWGDTVKAISSFQDAVARDPANYDAYMQLGLLLGIKKNPLAAGYFDNALSIKPRSIEALYGKARFFHTMLEYEKALAIYDTLLQLEPQHQDATFNIGAIYYDQKKYDAALEKFDLTVKRDANFFRGYYGRGRCYEAKGEKKKAIEEYKKCLAIKPDYELAAIQLDLLENRTRKKTG